MGFVTQKVPQFIAESLGATAPTPPHFCEWRATFEQ